ncbi:uncharacterized protein LOC102615549 isoform X2 [Citrus sinensis]|uniref:uncharacterized protein LOC102615549 isoform X2 n=1 Tax=Citrus sinensis TaxID=2711 RepID=UPI0003D736C4|nr:uncharacterized protein LOC102615549 isoform X2 [Citrus sinensis]
MDDIKMLADSVRSKFETLHPLSNGCCIYRVPQGWRCLHPNDYTPKMVSIGPLHHGNEELKAMEEHKLSLIKECPMGTRFGYTNLVEDLQSYCKSPWHSWKANLRQNYFNTPWASISVAGAVILLVLTLIQTACSVIGL